MDQTSQRQSRLISFEELRQYGIPYSRRQIDRREIQDKFPRRVALGVGKVAWVTDEIVEYVNKQIKSRSFEAGTLGSGDACKRPRKPRTAPALAKTATDEAALKSA